MNDRCAWVSKSTGRGVCDQPCEGRYCERHAKVVAVREAGAALRAASEAVAKARDAVVDAAKAYVYGLEQDGVPHILDAVSELEEAECVEAEARAKLEALR